MGDGKRKLVSIQEMVGMEGDVVSMQEIFTYKRTGITPEGTIIGHHTATGVRPRFAQRAEEWGFTMPESLFIDIMMNIGIIFYAAQQTNDADLLRRVMQQIVEDGFGAGANVVGDYLLVGAPVADEATGEVIVFENRDGEWVEIQRIRPEDAGPQTVFGANIVPRGDQAWKVATVRVSYPRTRWACSKRRASSWFIRR